MITKDELRRQIEEITGVEIEGAKVREVLTWLEKEGVQVFWACIPEDILEERF